jgi:hypothetical protein
MWRSIGKAHFRSREISAINTSDIDDDETTQPNFLNDQQQSADLLLSGDKLPQHYSEIGEGIWKSDGQVSSVSMKPTNSDAEVVNKIKDNDDISVMSKGSIISQASQASSAVISAWKNDPFLITGKQQLQRFKAGMRHRSLQKQSQFNQDEDYTVESRMGINSDVSSEQIISSDDKKENSPTKINVSKIEQIKDDRSLSTHVSISNESSADYQRSVGQYLSTIGNSEEVIGSYNDQSNIDDKLNLPFSQISDVKENEQKEILKNVRFIPSSDKEPLELPKKEYFDDDLSTVTKNEVLPVHKNEINLKADKKSIEFEIKQSSNMIIEVSSPINTAKIVTTPIETTNDKILTESFIETPALYSRPAPIHDEIVVCVENKNMDDSILVNQTDNRQQYDLEDDCESEDTIPSTISNVRPIYRSTSPYSKFESGASFGSRPKRFIF